MRGTTKPVPLSGWRICNRRYPKATVAVDAQVTPSQSVASEASIGRRSSAVTYAGVHKMTALALTDPCSVSTVYQSAD